MKVGTGYTTPSLEQILISESELVLSLDLGESSVRVMGPMLLDFLQIMYARVPLTSSICLN